MRYVESEIDKAISSLPILGAQKNLLLLRLLEYYRDAIEVLFMNAAHGIQFANGQSLEASIVFERDLHAGLFQALKWTMLFASPEENRPAPDADAIHELVGLAQYYEVLVDVLKMANHDRVTIVADPAKRLISVYEGGDVTGSDAQLFRHGVLTLPFRPQRPLVHDDDKLTAKWTAGEYRKLFSHLVSIVMNMPREEIVSTLGGQITPLFYRPALVQLQDLANSGQQAVLEDLTLTSDKVQGQDKWKLTTWFDTPFVLIGTCRIGLSNIIETLAGQAGDDYMLRTAVRCDSDQYSNVSGLREGRMLDFCQATLDEKGWKCEPHFKLRDPLIEIDIHAVRGTNVLVLQLKSTLRPETPWEVFKRNEDLIEGIRHTGRVLPLFQKGAIGFVITDGYRGDFQTWKESISNNVLTGTLEDIGEIAFDPLAACEVLKQRAGFDPDGPQSTLSDREFDLCGWKFCLTDSASPSSAR